MQRPNRLPALWGLVESHRPQYANVYTKKNGVNSDEIMPFASSSFYFYFTQSQTSQNSCLCLSILLISQLTFNLSCPVQPLYEDLCCLIVSCYVGVSWYSWDIFSGGETKEWSCGIGEVNGGDLEKWKMETLCLGCVAWEKNLKKWRYGSLFSSHNYYIIIFQP